MAEDLGEVRVNVEQEGAQDAADTIGEAVGEGAADGEGGGAAGGGIGGMLGGISAKLAGILGFVAFLASLKPIQEILGGLQRLFSVAILPLVALLTTFLRPILQKLLRFIGNLDFNSLGRSLLKSLGPILDRLPQIIAEAVNKGVKGALDFAGSDLASDFLLQTGQPDRVQQQVESGQLRQAPLGTTVKPGSIGEDILIQLDLLTEQSQTSTDAQVAEKSSTETGKNSVGPEIG